MSRETRRRKDNARPVSVIEESNQNGDNLGRINAREDGTTEDGPGKRRSSRKVSIQWDKEYAAATAIAPQQIRRDRPALRESDLETHWICAECKEAECLMNPEADHLLLCEGMCNRLFHYPCVGLAEIPPEHEPFICKDCIEQIHPCSYCKEYGKDDIDVFLCRNQRCGLFFHESCLSILNVEVHIQPSSQPSDGEAESAGAASMNTDPEGTVPDPTATSGSIISEVSCLNDVTNIPHGARRIFLCPAHHCWTCTQVHLKQQEADEAKAADTKLSKTGGKSRKKSRTGGSFFVAKKEATLFVRDLK